MRRSVREEGRARRAIRNAAVFGKTGREKSGGDCACGRSESIVQGPTGARVASAVAWCPRPRACAGCVAESPSSRPRTGSPGMLRASPLPPSPYAQRVLSLRAIYGLRFAGGHRDLRRIEHIPTFLTGAANCPGDVFSLRPSPAHHSGVPVAGPVFALRPSEMLNMGIIHRGAGSYRSHGPFSSVATAASPPQQQAVRAWAVDVSGCQGGHPNWEPQAGGANEFSRRCVHRIVLDSRCRRRVPRNSLR